MSVKKIYEIYDYADSDILVHYSLSEIHGFLTKLTPKQLDMINRDLGGLITTYSGRVDDYRFGFEQYPNIEKSLNIVKYLQGNIKHGGFIDGFSDAAQLVFVVVFAAVIVSVIFLVRRKLKSNTDGEEEEDEDSGKNKKTIRILILYEDNFKNEIEKVVNEWMQYKKIEIVPYINIDVVYKGDRPDIYNSNSKTPNEKYELSYYENVGNVFKNNKEPYDIIWICGYDFHDDAKVLDKNIINFVEHLLFVFIIKDEINQTEINKIFYNVENSTVLYKARISDPE